MENRESQIRALVRLALSDQDFADVEKDLIIKLGTTNGMQTDEVKKIIESEFHRDTEAKIDLEFNALSYAERFEYLYSLVQLMKSDHKIFYSEIKFCEKMAAKLGFIPEAVDVLSKHVFADEKVAVDREGLKLELRQYDFS
jgi:uncharacterized tellurite resistance protein B-like protein